jgi:hypothetical protein
MPNVANVAVANVLPTMNIGGALVQDLLQSILDALASDVNGNSLTIYQYAPSVSGWDLVEGAIKNWKQASPNRAVDAFVGTDHGLTDPLALEKMQAAGVNVHLLVAYSGIYHPKVFLLKTPDNMTLWVGSNNLTDAGLTKNVELAFKATAGALPTEIAQWQQSIRDASEPLTSALLASYRSERDKHEKGLANKGVKRFIWSKRTKPKTGKGFKGKAAPTGALVIEITPKETGAGGKQVQPPMAAIAPFFGLIGQSKIINARLKGSPKYKALTLTKMANSTARIVISELDYIDRPCFVVFEKAGNSNFDYEIVSQSVQPARYSALEKLAVNQSRVLSRRWAIV